MNEQVSFLLFKVVYYVLRLHLHLSYVHYVLRLTNYDGITLDPLVFKSNLSFCHPLSLSLSTLAY